MTATSPDGNTYRAEISRANPTCFLFLVDQSASMSEEISAGELAASKADVVADAINRLLAELTVKCGKEEGVRDYFHVGVIGYGRNVGPALSGGLADQALAPISAIAQAPARMEQRQKKVPDGAGGLVEQTVSFPIWLDAVADGATPMCTALSMARNVVAGFLEEHPNCFPPVVLNLTDGEATDGDPLQSAQALTELRSSDGAVLLFNLHVATNAVAPVSFPSTDALLGEAAARLFAMSSVLPEHLRTIAAEYGFAAGPTTRGFVYNADATKLVQFLDIGTQARDLR